MKARDVVISVALMVGAVGLSATLMAGRAQPTESAAVSTVRQVEVVYAQATSAQTTLEARGVIEAADALSIAPEISGMVLSLAEGLETGARFSAGAVLVQLDDREYRYRLAQEEAGLISVQSDLALEEGRGAVARDAWQTLGEGSADAMANRQPQLAASQANVRSQEAAVDIARLNLKRTTLRAPFDLLVTDRAVTAGQYVSPGGSLLSVVATDRFYARLSLPVEQLSLLDIPGFNAQTGGEVLLRQDLGADSVLVRTGTITGLAGELEPETRTAGVIVEIPDPLSPQEAGVPLLPGAYVQAELAGRSLEGVSIPRDALVDGRDVWVAEEGASGIVLARRSLQISWWGAESVVVSEGLAAGDAVVTTTLATPLPGMAVDIYTAQAAGGVR